MQIQALPGNYHIRYELVNPENASIKVKNLRIVNGPAIINLENAIQIYTPEKPT